MSLPFEAIISNRRVLSSMLDHFSLEQLNYIPDGFNNNIFWNIAHTAATMQQLVYSLSGSQWRIPKEIVKGYQKGTKPERVYTQDDVDAVKAILVSSAEQCEEDYKSGYFGDFHGFIAAKVFSMKTVEDAIQFNFYHEGLHMGYIQAIRRYVVDMA